MMLSNRRQHEIIEIDLEDDVLLVLAKEAHEEEITLNQKIVNIAVGRAHQVLMEDRKNLQAEVKLLRKKLRKIRDVVLRLHLDDLFDDSLEEELEEEGVERE